MATNRSVGKEGSDPDGVPEFRFTIRLPNKPLGTFREVSGLQVEVEVLDYFEGGNNERAVKLPGRLKYPNVVLKRGVTHQSNLLDWFNQTRAEGAQAKRGSLEINLRGPKGEEIRTWSFVDAFPVKWIGPTLNATSNAIATETLEIAHSGIET